MLNKWSVGIWLSESVVKPFVWWGCYDVVFFLAFAPQLSWEFRHVYDLSDQLQQAWLQSVSKKWTSIRQYRCGIVPKHVTPKRAVKFHELRFCSHKNVKNKIRRTYFLRSRFTNGWVLKHWTLFFASQSYDAQEYAPTTSSKPWYVQGCTNYIIAVSNIAVNHCAPWQLQLYDSTHPSIPVDHHSPLSSPKPVR